MAYLTLSLTADAASIAFNDETTISTDLTRLNLSMSDYVLIDDRDYDYTYVIAISESYNNNDVNLYVYFYDPYCMYNIDGVSISLNDSDQISYIPEFVSSDPEHNITKYRINDVASYDAPGERVYDVGLIFIGTNEIYDGFSATITQDGHQINYNYNSYIVVTDKELIEYCLPVVTTNRIWNSDYWVEQASLLYSYFGDDEKPQFFFLNFDTNKDIDRILEIDVTYSVVQGATDSIEWTSANSTETSRLQDQITMLTWPLVSLDENTRETFTAESPKTIYNEANDYSWYLIDGEVNMIVSPAALRFSTDGLNYYLNDWAKQSFLTRQHSVLIDVRPYSYFQEKYYVVGKIWHATKWQIEDASITRILYETNGFTYSARTNSGSLIDSVPGNAVPSEEVTQNWFDEILDWIANFLGLSKDALMWGIIGVIGLVALGILSNFIPPLALAFKGLLTGIKFVFKGLWFVITLPFRIIGYLVKAIRKKK